MYFCPCSCNDPLDPETEEHALVSLPRNLSYAEESYLDRYSTSAPYVHNPKIERKFQREQELEREAKVEDEQQRLLEAVLRARDYTASNSDFNKTYCFSHQQDSGDGSVSQPSSSSTNGAGCIGGPNGQSTGSKHSFVFHRPGCVHLNSSAVSATHPPSTVTEDRQQPKSPLPTEVEVKCPPSIPTQTPANETPENKGGYSRRSLLGPAVRVASKLSALLQSPPNESMDDHRGIDLGSSVDGDILTPITSPSSSISDSAGQVLNPDHLSQQIDRGADIDPCQQSDSTVLGVVDSDSEHTFITCYKVEYSHENDMESSDFDDNDIPNEPDLPDLFPKPFGGDGKTFFPRSDLSISSTSDQEEELVEIKENQVVSSEKKPSYGSPDSDAFSEEGVFMNMDDLDSNPERSNTVSEVSDDTCVSEDSVFLSPAEGELEEEEEKEGQETVKKMSIEEAINRAASDLTKLTMFEDQALSSMEDSTTTLEGDDLSEPDSTGRILNSVDRESPVRTPTGLKISITPNDKADGQAQQCQMFPLSDSPVYDEDEFNFSRSTLRKSSSLKTNKTPPGTPHRKKAVRFADAMGLDLESVRHVLNMESPPKIPPSAVADLRAGLEEDHKVIGSRYLCACFSQPGAEDNFHQRVTTQKVCLENAIITDLTITGVVRVANVSFHKSVRVRYTHNNWATFHDIAATYCLNSCDGPTDRFSFSIVAPADFSAGRKLEFAISYNAGGIEYWDNNDNKNYAFECFAKTVPMESETAWMHFI